ncbi:lipocalin family protein [Pseudomonas wadenswilerensis]
MAMRNPLLLSCLVLALAACSSTERSAAPPQTMQVDLKRYQGTWYEQARLPMFFQRNCLESEALYDVREDGNIDVTNRCKEKDGKWNEAHGIAEPQVPGRTDKLWVRFDNWFSRLAPGLTKGEYWVLYHDAEYKVALVGHPERKYLWLLSREREIDSAGREALLKIAHERGYDTRELVWRGTPQP